MEHRFSFRKIEETGRFADRVRIFGKYRACGTAGVMSLADGYRRKQFKAPPLGDGGERLPTVTLTEGVLRKSKRGERYNTAGQ